MNTHRPTYRPSVAFLFIFVSHVQPFSNVDPATAFAHEPLPTLVFCFVFLSYIYMQPFSKVDVATVRAPTTVNASEVAGQAEGLPEAAPPGFPRSPGHIPPVSPGAEKAVRIQN